METPITIIDSAIKLHQKRLSLLRESKDVTDKVALIETQISAIAALTAMKSTLLESCPILENLIIDTDVTILIGYKHNTESTVESPKDLMYLATSLPDVENKQEILEDILQKALVRVMLEAGKLEPPDPLVDTIQ